jgi:hypothetical protein
MKIACETCGTEFEFNKYQPDRRFCTRKCIRRIPPGLREAHFWGMAKPVENGCWQWQHSLNNKGYGQFGVPGAKLVLAHRHAWELTNGPIPEGMKVLHNCPGGDNPACINPAHLWLGSMLDNMQDAVAKQRMCRGQKHPLHKLTEENVRSIRAFREAGETFRGLAATFGVSPKMIEKIVHRRAWSHVI